MEDLLNDHPVAVGDAPVGACHFQHVDRGRDRVLALMEVRLRALEVDVRAPDCVSHGVLTSGGAPFFIEGINTSRMYFAAFFPLRPAPPAPYTELKSTL